NQSGNTITNFVADDIQPLAGFAGRSVTNFSLSVANLNTTAVTARPRVRIFLPDGPNLGPGTAIATLNFPQATFTGSSISLIVSGKLGPTQFVIPSSSFFWAGVAFDDFGGTTGATLAQMNNLGQGVFNPPTVGISDDVYFITTDPGVPGNSPPGSQRNFGGTPVANFGWQVQVAPVRDVPRGGHVRVALRPARDRAARPRPAFSREQIKGERGRVSAPWTRKRPNA